MSKGVSVIIPYHNDIEDLEETLDSLYATMRIEPWEVIVVNDGGHKKLKRKMRNLTHIDNPIHLGVGRSFDIGVSVANYDTIFLSGADITHDDSDYAEKMYNNVQENPRSIICTQMTSYTHHDRHFYGADLLFKLSEDDLPKESPLRGHPLGFRSILEGKWRSKTGEGIYELPCLMGAFYGVSRSYYDYLRGFELHYQWGSLEPYISLKSWLMGGSVLIDTDINVYHKSNRGGFVRKDEWARIYNRLMISFVVFGVYGQKFMEHLGSNPSVERAADEYMDHMKEIIPLREHIENNAVMTPQELQDKLVSMSTYHQKKGLTE